MKPQILIRLLESLEWIENSEIDMHLDILECLERILQLGEFMKFEKNPKNEEAKIEPSFKNKQNVYA